MSKARVCDNCNETLIVNDRGDDERGEIYAWLQVGTLDRQLVQDACSRSCAVALLADDEPLAEAVDARLAGVAEVVRALHSDSEDDDGVNAQSDETAP